MGCLWDHCSIGNRESCDRRIIPDLLSEHGAQNESGDALGDKRCVLARKRYPQSICQTENNGAFAGHMAVCFVLAVGAFYYQSMIALVLLLLFSSGECYMILRKAVEQYQIRLGVEKIRDGALSGKIDIEQLHGEEKSLAEAINNIGEGLLHAVDDSTKNERMKADLITNVSHDIKTPLTSIINYVNLMKLEKIDNERVQGYIQILDEKSQRLKQLTADLVEASKISSGNVKLDMQVIDLVELVYQTSGEFNEKFEQKELTIVTKLPKTAVLIRADGRQLYRVIENLYNNVVYNIIIIFIFVSV